MRAFDRLAELDQQVDFVLNHREMSVWLKTTLESAIDLDPVDVLNDLEILNQILPRRCRMLIGTEGVGKSRARQAWD